jgi:hypothetical protein
VEKKDERKSKRREFICEEMFKGFKKKGILDCVKEMVRDRRNYKTGNFSNERPLSAN